MMRPVAHVAAHRRMVALYMPALAIALLVFLVNYPGINGWTVFGMVALLGITVVAAVDLEMNL